MKALYPFLLSFFAIAGWGKIQEPISACCPPKTPPQKVCDLSPDLASDLSWYDELAQKGVRLASSYYLELAANPVGGKHQGFGNAGSFAFSTGLDLDKLAGIYGLSFFTSVCYRSGVNLSRKIDNQFEITQLYGGETYRLVELYLQESFFDGKFRIKAGRLAQGNDFLASPFYCEFVNLAFCGNPIGILFNASFLEFPFATWGAYLDFKPIPELLFKFAVYNNNRHALENRYHGANFTFHAPEGAMWMTEWLYLLSGRYPGNYKLGGYYLTGKADLFEGGKQSGNFGTYLLFDQMLYRPCPKTTEGLTAFGAFLFAPPNRNKFPFYLSSGLIYKGLFPSRKKDYLCFGVAYGAYSSDLAAAEHKAQKTGMLGPFGNKPQNFETIIEINYWARFTKWFAITPDFQYVINPKGYGTTPNAFVVAMQISIDFFGWPNQP